MGNGALKKNLTTTMNKPTINDIVIRVRLKTEIFGFDKYDTVAELVKEGEKVAEQINRHCDGVYDVAVCSDKDGALVTLGEWNKKDWS